MPMNLDDLVGEMKPPSGAWSKGGRRSETYEIAPFRTRENSSFILRGSSEEVSRSASITQSLYFSGINKSSKGKADFEIGDSPMFKAVIFDDCESSIGGWSYYEEEHRVPGSAPEHISISLKKNAFKELCDIIDQSTFSKLFITILMRKHESIVDGAQVIAFRLKFHA